MSTLNLTSSSIEFTGTKSEHNPCFREGAFINKQGIKIQTYDMQPSGPKKGIVVLVHGFMVHAMYEFLTADVPGGRHIVYEGSLPEKLVNHGFGVWLLDCQGHGLSSSPYNLKGYFERFSDLVNDLITFTHLIKKQDQNDSLPLFGCGSSMGGGIVTQAARVCPDLFTGMVLIAPMLSLQKMSENLSNRILRPVGEYASFYTPTARVALMKRNPHFPETLQEFLSDPLNDTNKLVRARTAWECYLFANDIIYNCHQITTPFLTLYSENDSLVDPDSSKILYRDAKSNDKSALTFNEMWHALLHEPGREQVIEAVINWLQERCSHK